MDITYRNEHHRLIVNLHGTHGHIVNHFQQTLAPYDLSVQQYSVLRQLFDVYPNSLAVGELKAKMTDQNSDMTRLTDRLVAKNLLVREVDPANRRRVIVRLTDEGYQLVELATAEFKNFESIISHLTDEEVKTMNTILDKIRKQ